MKESPSQFEMLREYITKDFATHFVISSDHTIDESFYISSDDGLDEELYKSNGEEIPNQSEDTHISINL